MDTIAAASSSGMSMSVDSMLVCFGGLMFVAGLALTFFSALIDEVAILKSASFIVTVASIIAMAGLSIRVGNPLPVLFIICLAFLLNKRKRKN